METPTPIPPAPNSTPSDWFRDAAVLVEREFKLESGLAREAREEAIEILQALRNAKSR